MNSVDVAFIEAFEEASMVTLCELKFKAIVEICQYNF